MVLHFFYLYVTTFFRRHSLDKTIKLWKVFEKSLRVVSESNHFDGHNTVLPPTQRSLLRLPRTTQQDNIIAAIPRKVYANAHAYHIHSISVNSDQETYISADDLRINLWNLNISNQSFSEFWCSRAGQMMTNVILFRHCRHQTSQYGRIDGSHYSNGIPSNSLQSFHVLQFKK